MKEVVEVNDGVQNFEVDQAGKVALPDRLDIVAVQHPN